MDKLLVLIDGAAIAYRSYFALIRNPLINSRGENTGAVFGFTQSILKLLDEIKPSHLGCVFDTAAPTFRHELYDEYKSTRAKMPDELADSLPWIKDVLAALHIPVLEREGFEADDIIGTLALKAAEAGYQVGMFTGDKDFCQLVNDRIKVLHPKTFDWLDENGVKAKMGVPPDKIIDLLALMGDTSDHVPGVPGVGEKTALKLLGEFGDFETVLRSAASVSQKKLSQSLKDNADLARLSHQLVTIQTDAPVEFDEASLMVSRPDSPRLAELFKRFEFKSLYLRFSEPVQQPALEIQPQAKAKYEMVDSLERLESILAEAQKIGEAAIDTETTSKSAIEASLVGISLSFKEGEAYYVPVGHLDDASNLPFESVLERFSKFFRSKTKLIGQNLKYDRQVFANHGLGLQNIYFDTMIASYLVNPGRRSHKLDYLALEYLDYRMQPITDLIGKGAKQISFAKVPVDKATFYAAEDADYTLRLKNRLQPILHEHELERLFFDLEMPLLSVLGDMEKEGVAIDRQFLEKLSVEYDNRMKTIERNIYEEAGQRFNISSPIQLRAILFDKLQLPSSKKTAKGREKSTDVDVLALLWIL